MTARRMWCWYLANLVVVVVCAVALMAAWQLHRGDEELATNRSEVLELAGPAVSELFSSDPGETESQRRRALAVVTDEFAREYGQLLDSPTAPTQAVTVTWRPVHTSIASVAADHVDTVVSAAVTEERPGAESVAYTKVLDVRFERSGGDWKIARADEVL
ncbi:hypothetical protein [Williamsia soli]|uniref:hypothetical protein n=1 Tax=Williamsia soli TaxID=364929 RepID=UPI001A9E0C1E|nr:hypothetical protein [Williamsia soli]